mgnify:CR=1 FL=1
MFDFLPIETERVRVRQFYVGDAFSMWQVKIASRWGIVCTQIIGEKDTCMRRFLGLFHRSIKHSA